MTVVVLLLVLLELGSILLQLLQPIDIFLVVHVFYFIYLEIVSIVSNYPHHHLAGIWSIIYSFNMAALQPAKMIYRNFGNSGLKLSVISVGTAINNKPNNYEQDKQIIAAGLKNGINHFDTAEVYGGGQSQTRLGQILKDLKVPREQVVIATKILTASDSDINSKVSTNRKHIRQSVQKSLKRLQLDYVDIIYAHVYDQITPIQQICRGFNQVIEKGLAFYWATSNWDAETVFKALGICEKLNLHKPIGSSSEYNMLNRQQNEIQYQSLYSKYNYGLIGWSSLAGGILTGKYLDGFKDDEVTRFTEKNSSFPLEAMRQLFYAPKATEKNIKSLIQLKKIADEEIGCKLTHLALAWAIKYPHLDSAIIGARNAQQLEECLGALQILDKFTPELQKRINKILDTTPTPLTNFKQMKPFAPIRPVAKDDL